MGGKRSFVRRAIDRANHRLANTLAAAPQPASGSSDGKCIHALIQVHNRLSLLCSCMLLCMYYSGNQERRAQGPHRPRLEDSGPFFLHVA